VLVKKEVLYTYQTGIIEGHMNLFIIKLREEADLTAF
jgi:hypothetical protein